MELIHIATTDTFFVDAPKHEGECWICGTRCEQEMGWIGMRCSKCNSVYDSEMGLQRVVRMRRELMNLSRRQMADKCGIKASTVKKYEWVWPSKHYCELTATLIKEPATP
jgi:hypothetical protein